MLLTFSGDDPNFLENAFQTNAAGNNLVEISFSSTQLVFLNTLTNYTFTIKGSGFVVGNNGLLPQGTITGVILEQNGTRQASLSDISWSITDLEAVLNAAPGNDDLLEALGISNGITLTADPALIGIALDDIFGAGPEIFEGSALPDLTLIGSSFNDRLFGATGNDTVDGGTGIDTYIINAARNDVLVVDRGNGEFGLEYSDLSFDIVSNVEFFEFNDQTVAAENLAAIPGELIVGDDDDNFLNGSGGDDTVVAARGDDTVIASAGDDDVRGDGGNDRILGETGNDTLRGGRGEDTILGGNDDDVIRGQSNGDSLEGGGGNDNIKGGGGNDTLRGDAGNDFLKGGSRRDEVYGGFDDDVLAGNSFDDLLDGGSGNDTLRAGGDNDTLIGGADDDILKGGGGADTFVFEIGFDLDRIIDFSMAEDVLAFGPVLGSGLDAQMIEDMAEIVDSDLVIDFGGGGRIELADITETEGLADVISFV